MQRGYGLHKLGTIGALARLNELMHLHVYVPHGGITSDRLRNRTAGYVTGWPVT